MSWTELLHCLNLLNYNDDDDNDDDEYHIGVASSGCPRAVKNFFQA